MTSTVSGGRGSPKSKQKERGGVNSVRDKGERGYKNPKILRMSYNIDRPFLRMTMPLSVTVPLSDTSRLASFFPLTILAK